MCAYCACLHCLCSRVFVCVARSPCVAQINMLPPIGAHQQGYFANDLSKVKKLEVLHELCKKRLNLKWNIGLVYSLYLRSKFPFGFLLVSVSFCFHKSFFFLIRYSYYHIIVQCEYRSTILFFLFHVMNAYHVLLLIHFSLCTGCIFKLYSITFTCIIIIQQFLRRQQKALRNHILGLSKTTYDLNDSLVKHWAYCKILKNTWKTCYCLVSLSVLKTLAVPSSSSFHSSTSMFPNFSVNLLVLNQTSFPKRPISSSVSHHLLLFYFRFSYFSLCHWTHSLFYTYSFLWLIFGFLFQWMSFERSVSEKPDQPFGNSFFDNCSFIVFHFLQLIKHYFVRNRLW